MSSQAFGARRPQPSPSALSLLDAGLRVRIEVEPLQRMIFSAPGNASEHDLTDELAALVSRLRVHSFAVRADVEHVMTAVQMNVRCGFWPLARRAALDLAAMLAQARKRGLADHDLAVRGANVALRVAELCGKEVRS
jgi:hypothetical protein